MKTLKLKVGKEEHVGRPTFITTYDLLRTAINNPEQGGFDVEEMMKRLRLLEKVDQFKDKFTIKDGEFTDEKLLLEDTLELEDSDYEKLKELVKKMKWGIVSKFIVDLHQDLK